MGELGNVLARLREAREPDREIDLAVLFAIDPSERVLFAVRLGQITRKVEANGLSPHRAAQSLRDHVNTAPRFTASIDAAVALIERALPGWWGDLDIGNVKDGLYGVRLFAPDPPSGRETWVNIPGEAPTPALALLIALFEALIARESAPPNPDGSGTK